MSVLLIYIMYRLYKLADAYHLAIKSVGILNFEFACCTAFRPFILSRLDRISNYSNHLKAMNLKEFEDCVFRRSIGELWFYAIACPLIKIKY